MGKKMRILLGAVAVAMVPALVLGGVAIAGEGDDGSGYQPRPWEQWRCRGVMLGRAIYADALTELLDMGIGEIREQQREGKSLVEIAAEQGISEEVLIDTLVAAVEEKLQQKVDDGTITQERADLILERVRERISDIVNRIPSGSPMDMQGRWGGRNGCGMGRMRGGR